MGKSEHGPDMLDCCQYARMIEESLGLSVTVLLEPVGLHAGQCWRLHALAVKVGHPEAENNRSAAAQVVWPHREHKTFEGALFALLALLDASLSQQSFLEAVNITA